MVIREVRTVGLWVAVMGILIGIFGFINLGAYVPERGFFWNVQRQTVVFPLLHGDNPLSCVADSFRRLIPNPTGAPYKPEPGCHVRTTMPFNYLLTFSVFLVIVGVCLLLHKVEIPNPWPTEWSTMGKKSKSASDAAGDPQGPRDRSRTSSEGGG